jgi:hypothetical protein
MDGNSSDDVAHGELRLLAETSTLSMIEKYTEGANKKKLAEAGMAKRMNKNR